MQKKLIIPYFVIGKYYFCSAMVDQVTIKGYKSFKELNLKLGGVNLLIGSNGSGKSNFLSMFEMLNNAFEQRLANYVATLGGVSG